MFYGRDEEIKKIKSKISSDKFENILVSGRRRIGKTSLLTKIYNDFEGKKIFFSPTQGSYSNRFKSLWQLIAKTFDCGYNLSEIQDILDFIFEKSKTEKVLFIIDEYPYLSSNYEPLDSILQHLIDHNKDKSKMKLIISGSYVKAINNLISHSNPLYRRFTDRIILNDLNYLDVAKFYPNFSLEDKVKMYAVFGGNPFYNSFVNPNLSFEENVIENVLKNSFLLDSPIKIYGDEIKNIDGANSIFENIGNDKHKYSDLVSDVVSITNLPYALEPLLEMGLIKKEHPINMGNNKKKTFYYIEDNFIDFYYRYIYLNYDSYISLTKDNFFEKFIKKDLEEHFIPKKFEKLCREAILYMNLKELNNVDYIKIGKYWYDDPENKTNMEFDVVCESLDNTYTFFEAKFSKHPIDESIVNKKIYQIEKIKLDKYKLGFISRSGFDLQDKKDYVLFDLKDLYLE